MAVTHADLAPGNQYSDLGSKTGVFLMFLSILFGLGSFILCLIAETTRSQVSWVVSNIKGEERYECIYSASGRIPLVCACGAFLGLAIAMVMEHAYMLIAVSKSSPPAIIAWSTQDSNSVKSLTWRAGFFFITTWICFAVAEVLLLIGLGVESGHIRKWWRPRPSCLVIREGLFLAAGVFGLTTVFLASGLYLTALRAQKVRQEEENFRHELFQTSILYASPPRSPRGRLFVENVVGDNPVTNRQEHNTIQPLQREPQSFVFHKPISSNQIGHDVSLPSMIETRGSD
ncbi:hypothetical protein MKW98_004646 [Papaver atlanticum]|uniref:Transmembrane protein n=1 Tax=Papaver atlanticum TaxID=357466 RepID=A0AAD4SQG1_9MAGN|nr:hypothetical protein MKW98_004646 [Papaver atlanticum]